MSHNKDMEEIEREVRDLILHSKSKRTTFFEPCNEANLSEYLISIKEELCLYGVKFMFNQFSDLDEQNDKQLMVRLVNAIWNLLMQHKEITNNGNKLKERNYSLQQNNFYLNSLIEKLKNDLEANTTKWKEIEESKRQLICKLDTNQKELSKSKEEVKKLKKQMVSKEDQLVKQVKKSENNYSQLQDKMRGNSGIYVSRNESNNSCIEEYKLREKKYKETILKLQQSNRQLLIEVISLKEDILGSDKDE